MSSFIELQRSRLEENDVLRHETFKRFRKNPELVPSDIRQADDILSTKNSRPHKESLRQKHEIAIFKNQYDTNTKSLNTVVTERKSLVQDSIEKIHDADFTFQYFDELFDDIRSRQDLPNYYQDLKSVYSMYSSSPMRDSKTTVKGKLRVKKKFVTSEAASRKFNIETQFSPEEQFGKHLDLRKFHTIYKESSGSDIDYLEYIKSLLSSTIQIKDPQPLVAYFKDYLRRTEPLLSLDEVEAKMVSELKESNGQNKSDETGEVFCDACGKSFKSSVYKGHLSGKKHQKNIKNKTSVAPATPQISLLKPYIKLLKPKFDDTINYVVRHNAMTDREKMIELGEMEGDESDYTTANSEPSDAPEVESSDDDDDTFKNLPLGTDGTPIPFWLFKLQGLNQSYNCEVCGNITYKGRLTFEKHFTGSKHQQGLRFLGIDQNKMHLFNDVSKINEATELWRSVRKQASARDTEAENAVEVEDKDGNVLSEKDYADLKKQGLL